MEEVLHIEDYDWWCEELDSLRALKRIYERGKARGYNDWDYDKLIAKKEAEIKDIENKITQIENLKQNVKHQPAPTNVP